MTFLPLVLGFLDDSNNKTMKGYKCNFVHQIEQILIGHFESESDFNSNTFDSSFYVRRPTSQIEALNSLFPCRAMLKRERDASRHQTTRLYINFYFTFSSTRLTDTF